MTKLGMKSKRTFEDALREHKAATTNRPGGLAFDFESPAEFLLATIGSALFVEPKYHPDTLDPKKLRDGDYSTDNLDEQAVKIIEACREIARGPNPKDLLSLAHWARVEMNMRTTPQIMLAVAANTGGTKPFVRRYVPRISRRADDVLQVVAAYEHLFGRKAFPASLKKGVADRMSKLTEYEILKYNRKGHPSFKDLLRFCERRKGYPLSPELRHYIFTGEVLNAKATPIIAARRELTARGKVWADDIPLLAKKAAVTWEVLVSQFGSRPEVWEAMAPLIPYMALIRNVANLLDSGMPAGVIRQVAARIGDAKAVAKSKQLPFRFVSLYRMLSPAKTWYSSIRGYKSDRDRSGWDQRSVQLLMEAVESALDHSVANVPELPGVTCIASDNSGSMSYPLSKGSSVTLLDTANVLAAIVHQCSEESYVAAFGNKAVWPPLTKRNSVVTNMNEIANYKANYRGQATNAFEVFKHLFDKKIHVDRIVILSDMQCYDTSGGNRSVAEFLTKYRREVNPNAYAHFFDLKGYGTGQTSAADPLSNIVAGFSERIFNQILNFEGVEEVKGERVLPTLEYVRENY